MAIYYCPKCNKKYFLDDKEQNSPEFQREFKCGFCGTGFDNEQGNVVNPTLKSIDNDIKEIHKQNVQTNNTSAEWELLLKIERKQLETLEDIKSMIKFFFILTIIGLVISIIIPFL